MPKLKVYKLKHFHDRETKFMRNKSELHLLYLNKPKHVLILLAIWM